MEDLTRRKAMNLAAISGIAAAGLVTLGASGAQAQAQAQQQGDQEPRISEEELRGLEQEESPPPEGEEGQEPQAAQAQRLAFIAASSDAFLVSGRRGAVLLNLRNTVAANRAVVREGARFYYLTMSPNLPRFAIAKTAGLLGLHQVWIRTGSTWTRHERAAQKRLEGNIV
jgi:hypothetical protein